MRDIGKAYLSDFEGFSVFSRFVQGLPETPHYMDYDFLNGAGRAATFTRESFFLQNSSTLLAIA